jgi:quinolinate synthase
MAMGDLEIGTEALAFTPAIAQATRDLYGKVSHVVPEIEWAVHAPYIKAINDLKRQKNAVILGHNYMTPEIFHCVADFVGDSLQLAREAAKTDAKVIVQAGVHFMAETSKILSPGKTILIPDPLAGCSLAASITGADVRLLRQKYPGLPVVTYVNTSADVKAESDVCCTSSNAVQVVEDIAREWRVDTVIMIPDEYLAQNVAKQTSVKIISWKGRCEVHERFSAADIRSYREANPGVIVLAHPECPPEVVAASDFAGSTSAMIGYVGKHRPARVVMVTECSMSDNVAVEFPDVDFVRPCNLCPHMKRITLPKILHSLQTMTVEVTVDPEIAARAKCAVDRMLAVGKPQQRVAA